MSPKRRIAIDLSKVSDEDLTREYMRRHNARRAQAGGRQKVLRPCPIGCGQDFGAREMQKHIPQCRIRQALTIFSAQQETPPAPVREKVGG